MDPVKDKSIEDTGERMVPAYHKGHLVYGEHIVRYQAAAELVRGKVVLDIASGSGYGSACLGETAKQVTGVDIDNDAIAYAKKNYASKTVDFVKGDGIKIPLDDNSVDAVVSFETIEHIEDYQTFMAEVKRVLKNDGIFLLSTPNDIEFPETNHYHIYEFEQKELKKLISKFFSETKWYFEGTWLADALLEEKDLITEWEQEITVLQTAPVTLKKCLSFFVICANRKIIEAARPRVAIAEHYSERRHQEYEKSVRDLIEEQGKIIKHLENELSQKKAQIHDIHNSRTWKLASRLKKVRGKKS
jgi:ubiquinone/menaquinone biosynthesis C-methylase UbiE